MLIPVALNWLMNTSQPATTEQIILAWVSVCVYLHLAVAKNVS